MRKLRIVLCGDHGMELDSHTFEVREDQLEDRVITNALIGKVQRDWYLNIGDTIKIVEA